MKYIVCIHTYKYNMYMYINILLNTHLMLNKNMII